MFVSRERPNVRHDLKTEPGRTEPNLQTERSVRFGKLPTLVRFGLVRFGKNLILVRFGLVRFCKSCRTFTEPDPNKDFPGPTRGCLFPLGIVVISELVKLTNLV